MFDTDCFRNSLVVNVTNKTLILLFIAVNSLLTARICFLQLTNSQTLKFRNFSRWACEREVKMKFEPRSRQKEILFPGGRQRYRNHVANEEIVQFGRKAKMNANNIGDSAREDTPNKRVWSKSVVVPGSIARRNDSF